jgi:hypothetical protein
LSGFKATADRSEVEDMKAIAHLPGLDIEILHRPSPDGQGEQISITLTAIPSFEAFAKTFEMLNPFALWAEAMRFAWAPWLDMTRAMTPPAPLPRLGSGHSSYPSDRR